MKKLTPLAVSVGACLFLTQCTPVSDTTMPKQADPIPNGNPFHYPTTRTNADSRDDFLNGEYGRSSNFIHQGTGKSELADTGGRLRPDDGVDIYFGEKLVDKYRWLEEVDSISLDYLRENDASRERNTMGGYGETKFLGSDHIAQAQARSMATVKPEPSSEINDWVNAQNKTTADYMNAIPYGQAVKDNIIGLWNIEHDIQKIKKDGVGEIYYYRHPDGFERIDFTDVNGKKTELLNVANLSEVKDAYIPNGEIYVSPNGKHLVYFVTPGSSDADSQNYMNVIEIATGKKVLDSMPDTVANDIIWLNDDSFYYIGKNKSGWADNIKRHDIGKKRFNDPILANRNARFEGMSISSISMEGDEDSNRYMLVEGSARQATFYIYDVKKDKAYRIHSKKQYDKFYQADGYTVGLLAKFIDFDEKTGDVWFISEENDTHGQILKTNIHNPKVREVVVPANPEFDRMVDGAYHRQKDGYFLIRYLKDGSDKLILTDYHGKPLKDLTPKNGASVTDNIESHLASEKDNGDKVDYITFRTSNTVMPRTVFKYSVDKDEFISIKRRDWYPFDEHRYESHTVLVTSKDGTQIPAIIAHKKGVTLNGKNPTILYGYGGFGSAVDSRFRLDRASWLEHNGIWVTAILRGGAEKGEQWHAQGKRLNRHNVFDDFESVADYLSEKGYASPDYLAIHGASNGGMLTAAAMTLAPSKYRVAHPDVPVADMLRHGDAFYKSGWATEYGTPHDSREMYQFLKSYSPYQNLKAGVCYPSTMITTSKRDDRVTPAHSYKFAARLQEVQACQRPTLLFTNELDGHHPYTWEGRVNDAYLLTAFTLNEMGIKALPTIDRPTKTQMAQKDWHTETPIDLGK